jgi:hypothetical protein
VRMGLFIFARERERGEGVLLIDTPVRCQCAHWWGSGGCTNYGFSAFFFPAWVGVCLHVRLGCWLDYSLSINRMKYMDD